MGPVCIDACCGRWGWGRAFRDAGYRVIGIDNNPRCEKYADGMEFICADIRDLSGWELPPARAFVASPPCTDFSTAKNLSRRFGAVRDTERGMVLVRECVRIARENRADYWCLENVQGAVKPISAELGQPRLRKHSYFLWGNFPGFILPSSNPLRKSQSVETRAGEKPRSWRWMSRDGTKAIMGPRSAALRAVIPYPLARALAEACKP
jgi:hypothetical protein